MNHSDLSAQNRPTTRKLRPLTRPLSFAASSGSSRDEARYHALIGDGEEMGIFTWMLFSHSCGFDAEGVSPKIKPWEVGYERIAQL